MQKINSMNNKELVLVYTMGKCGSASMDAALAGKNRDVLHVHFLYSPNLSKISQNQAISKIRSFKAIDLIIRNPGKIKIVTLVRDPIARQLSTAFAKFHTLEEYRDDVCKYSADRHIVQKYWSNFSKVNQRPFVWFQTEFFPFTGIDIYQYDVNPEGYIELHTDRFDVLLLKCEISDDLKSKYVSRFIGDDIAITHDHGIAKFGDAYKEFKKHIDVRSYFEQIKNKQYSTHFYPDTYAR